MVNLPPDSRRYLAMHRRRVCRPFHLRWLLPILLRSDVRTWTWVTRTSVVAIAAFTAIYTGSPWMACVAFLPAFTWLWKHPVMVDAYGMALALGSAICLLHGWWPAAIVMAVAAGMVRETAPVWAAIYSWNPLLLVGLLPVAVRWLQKPGADVFTDHNAYLVAHPLEAGRLFHRGRWRDPLLMVTPWGGLIVGVGLLGVGLFDGGVSNSGGGQTRGGVVWGGLLDGWVAPGSDLAAVAGGLSTGVGFGGPLQLAVALGVGYAQLLIATDSVRLFQWGAPVLAFACVSFVPIWLLPFIAASVVFNPWRGDGE